ncbi:MAG: hypothetical protein OXF21_04805 [bacterium]|nr:hypothetical protein [bacterium]
MAVDAMHVELFEVSLKLRRPITTSKGTLIQRDGILVKISQGSHIGWGEAMCFPGWPGADLAVSRNALETWAARPDPAKLPHERFAHAAIELALLDIEAQQTGKTQAAVLAHNRPTEQNGPTAQTVPVHALVASPTEATAAVKAGYSSVKLKVGMDDLATTIERVGAVRSAIGDRVGLRLDANGAWLPSSVSTAQLVHLLGKLAPYNIEYIEEPTTGLANLAELGRHSPIPVAADESLSELNHLSPTASALTTSALPPSIGVVVIKPMAIGGPKTAYALASQWIAQGQKMVATNYLDSAVGQHAALSVAAALPGPTQVCGAITPELFEQDLARLPAVAYGHCSVPTTSPTPQLPAGS